MRRAIVSHKTIFPAARTVGAMAMVCVDAADSAAIQLRLHCSRRSSSSSSSSASCPHFSAVCMRDAMSKSTSAIGCLDATVLYRRKVSIRGDRTVGHAGRRTVRRKDERADRRRACRRTGRRTGRQTNRSTTRLSVVYDRRIVCYSQSRWACLSDKQTDRQIDKQTDPTDADRQTKSDRQKDRQADR